VLDPLSPNVHADAAIVSALRGADELFEEQSVRVLDMDPAIVKVYWYQMKSRTARKNWDGAGEAAECALKHMPEDPVTLACAAASYAASGNIARAVELRSKLEFLSQIRYVPKITLALAHEIAGSEEAFFRMMERAIADREPLAHVLRVWRVSVRLHQTLVITPFSREWDSATANSRRRRRSTFSVRPFASSGTKIIRSGNL